MKLINKKNLLVIENVNEIQFY